MRDPKVSFPLTTIVPLQLWITSNKIAVLHSLAKHLFAYREKTMTVYVWFITALEDIFCSNAFYQLRPPGSKSMKLAIKANFKTQLPDGVNSQII